MSKLLSLDRGHYLGSILDICYADGIIAGTTTYAKGADTNKMHYHDNPHISFVLQGGSVEKRKGREYDRLPANIMFYRAGEAHQNIQKIFPSKNINLEIENEYLKRNEISEEAMNFGLVDNPDGKFLMLKMYKEILNPDQYSIPTINMLFLALVSKFEKINYKTKSPNWLRIVHELVNDRWDKKLTLSELAIAADINPITISKHFHKYFSCTLGEYMRKLKVMQAMSLINETKHSLTEIAYTCNFADQSHFTRIFKQFTGFLPAHYKKLKNSQP